MAIYCNTLEGNMQYGDDPYCFTPNTYIHINTYIYIKYICKKFLLSNPHAPRINPLYGSGYFKWSYIFVNYYLAELYFGAIDSVQKYLPIIALGPLIFKFP